MFERIGSHERLICDRCLRSHEAGYSRISRDDAIRRARRDDWEIDDTDASSVCDRCHIDPFPPRRVFSSDGWTLACGRCDDWRTPTLPAPESTSALLDAHLLAVHRVSPSTRCRIPMPRENRATACSATWAVWMVLVTALVGLIVAVGAQSITATMTMIAVAFVVVLLLIAVDRYHPI